jgi:molecular chaperone DnaK (HSP70)
LLYMDYEENIYEVKDVIGDNFLGGEDLTQYLYEYIIKFIEPEYLIKQKNQIKIRKACEIIKKELSYKSESKIFIELENTYFSKVITRHKFNEICKTFFDKIRELIRYIIKSNMYIDINKVVFVGGSTRVNYFETIFKEEIKQIKICNSIDPDITVSVGAAIQGGLLTDNTIDGLLMDIIPMSLGVEAEDGIMSVIISRNTVIPVEMKKEFVNSSDYEDSIAIKVYQGERRFVKDNYFLGEFVLNHEKLKEYPKGKIIIDITFSVDTDGIISVSACAKIKGDTIIFNVKKINGNTEINTFNLTDIISSSVVDSIMENKIVVKNELYNSFKTLLSAYHQNSIELDEYSRDILNNMYEKVFMAIRDFKEYEIEELQNIKKEFENDWHKLVFSGDIGGGTTIE